MSLNGSELYAFHDFRLDVGERLLLRKEERIQLPEKAFETLCVLVRRNGHLVTKDELLAEVWPDTVVEENNLDKNVSLLRRALNEQNGKHKFIETVRGRGYRFVGDATRLPLEDDPVQTSVAPSQISSQPSKTASYGPNKRTAGNLAAVVSLADWRHETGTTDKPVAERPPKSVKAPLGYRRNWLVAIAVAVCAALGILGFYSWSEDKTGEPINSIAVLPFVNVSADAELEYLSDGLSETLIDRLSELPQLKVIARSSSFKFRDDNTDIQAVAQKLGVDAIVIGRVVRRGDDLNIRVELVDARDNKQIWGEQFVRKGVDAGAVEAEIARRVSDRLRLKLSGEQERQLSKKGTDNPEAYDLLLKGDFLFKKSATRTKALEYYEKAISLDPNYALAYARLAATYQNLGSGALDPKDILPKVQAAARKAIDLDENLAEAHLVLAQLAQDDWDWTTAELEYQRALELNPNLVTVHQRYSAFLSCMGQNELAIAEAIRAKELDPQQILSYFVVSRSLHMARRFDETIAEVKKLRELDPTFAGFDLGIAYTGKGMYPDAIAAYKEAMRLGGDSKYLKIALGATYARAGERRKALAILHGLETSTDYVAPGELAILYEALGDREKAVETLEKAYTAHDLQLQYLKADPGFDSMHDDPRFQDLVRRVGLPQ